MKTAVISVLMNFVSVEFIAKIIAMGISKLISYASRKGGATWTKVKGIMKKIENWIHLFNEVYEDDEMTPEEEAKVAEAIAGLTTIKKVSQIISDRKK